jgi:hypothetical protein
MLSVDEVPHGTEHPQIVPRLRLLGRRQIGDRHVNRRQRSGRTAGEHDQSQHQQQFQGRKLAAPSTGAPDLSLSSFS